MTRSVAHSWETAFIGCGSNLGDRLAWLCRGRELLRVTDGVRLAASSRLYQSPPCGGPPGQGDYLNGVLQVATRLPPEELLARCLEIEAACGRVRHERWGARTLDLDLLLYADRTMATERLILPHPRLHLRPFVLAPLCELAPQALHPLLHRPVCAFAAVADLSTTTLCRDLPPEGW